MAELSEVGLLLNADKTVVLTSQSQPPSTITTEHGITLKVLPGNVAKKWLGCVLTAYGSEQKNLDLQYHLQQAAKVICQQMDSGGPEGSYFSASPLF